VLDREGHRLLRLQLVGRLDDRDVGQRSQAGDVLQAHLAVAVLTDGDAGVRAHQLDVGVGVGHRDPDGLEPAHHEAGERAHEGDSPAEGQTGPDADHVLLGDARVEGSLGEFLGEVDSHRRLAEVGVHRHDPFVARTQVQQGFAEGGASGFGRHWSSSNRCYDLSSARSSFTMARVAESVAR
jgi:hypothetical protein